MHPRNLVRTVFAVAIALTFACSLIPTPQPTEPPTFELSSPQTDFDEAKVTDSEGVAIFEDTGSSLAIKVQIQDDKSKSRLQGIQVQVLSNGPEVVVIALDTNRVYFPVWEIVKPTSSLERLRYSSFGVSSVRAQADLSVVLELTDYYSYVEAGLSFYDYWKDKKDIRNFTSDSIDQCFTGPQLVTFFELYTNVVLAVIPSPPGITDARVKQIIKALWTTFSTSAQIDASLYLQSLPGAYLFRFHIVRRTKFTSPQAFALSLMPFEYLGPCEPQTDTEPIEPEATATLITLPTPTSMAQNPTLTLNQTSNCREGPSPAYEVVYSFEAGTQFEIIGKYGSGWWLVPIDLSFTRKKSCWIYEEGNTTVGDVTNVPNVEPSPLPPTEAPEPSAEMPIYDFYSQSIIEYISCSEASKYEWESDVWSETGEPVYFSSALYGNAPYGVYERDAKNICGW